VREKDHIGVVQTAKLSTILFASFLKTSRTNQHYNRKFSQGGPIFLLARVVAIKLKTGRLTALRVRSAAGEQL